MCVGVQCPPHLSPTLFPKYFDIKLPRGLLKKHLETRFTGNVMCLAELDVVAKTYESFLLKR